MREGCPCRCGGLACGGGGGDWGSIHLVSPRYVSIDFGLDDHVVFCVDSVTVVHS